MLYLSCTQSTILIPVQTRWVWSGGYCSTTSISNQIDIPEKYTLHPNPAIDFITIKSNTGFSSIKVLDMSGKVRKTEDYFSDGLDHSIDISNLNSGMYIMQILDDKKQISKVKFIVTD
jgi:hypothetical protein